MSAGLPDETPDLVMGPLRIRVLRRQFPEAEDYWDANWLVVHAVVSTPRSRAEARGPLLHLGDLVAWREHLARIEPGRNADVELGATEPDVSATIRLDPLGRGSLVVRLRAGVEEDGETHTWAVPVDASHLPRWIASLDALLARHPLHGSPP